MNMEDLIREAVKEFIEEQTIELPDPPEGMDVADFTPAKTGLGDVGGATVDTDVETDLDTDTPAEMPDLPKPKDLPDVPGGATMEEEYRVDGQVRPVHTKNYVQDQNINARYLDKRRTGQRVPKQWEDAAETMTTDRVGAASMGPEDAQARRADDFSKYDVKGGAVREEERPRFGRPGHEDWSPDPSAAAMGSQNQVNVAETKETLKEWKNRTLNEMLMSKFIKKESK